MKHLTMTELEAGLDTIRLAPKNEGVLKLIVRRPRIEEREVLEEGELHPLEGLVGDSWKTRGSSRTPDGSAHPEMQLNIMNSRVVELLAQDKDRWQLAGDQLYLDMDLSAENLPAGTQLALGSAVIEVSPQPHTGCKKFVSRFGLDAMKFVNSSLGRELHLRGINAKVVRPGLIRVGDLARKIEKEQDDPLNHTK
ncbi:MAG: MOSC domain-containing protein [Acidobacteriota bacterium]